MMIQSVWKNLTGLQKAKSSSQLNTSGVTLNKDLEPKIHHQTPMICTFIILTKVLGHTLFLEEKKACPNCGNKEIHVLNNCIPTSATTVLKCMKWLYPYVQVIGVWWWVFGSMSAFKVTPEVFSWDEDLAFCRPVKFFHTDWIIISLWSLPYTQRHCHVRIKN